MWEVRHAGLLGIKYEVAVRSDLIQVNETKDDSEPSNKTILRDVVDATVLGYAFSRRSKKHLVKNLIDSATETTTFVPLPHPACSRSLVISWPNYRKN